jgi:hypothetical protein
VLAVLWEKKRHIFKADNHYPWMSHHAAGPLADRLNERVLRIYFGTRDVYNRTVAAFIEVEADHPANVLYVHDRPALSLGKPGSFDDSGVSPSCLVNHRGKKFLYYTGWNQSVTVPYRNSIGLAVSEDGGRTFERLFEGPVLDRNHIDPYFCMTPFVMIDEGKWKLWYGSTTGFITEQEKAYPVYQIKYAESDNGFEWVRRSDACIEYKFPGEANARPCVIKENGIYRMWYCFRGSTGFRTDKNQSYRIGYADSLDGTRWRRKDEIAGIERSEEGWDSLMMEYPFVYEHRGIKHMLYNGNGFGETGFGYAVMTEDDRAWR